jgi:GT2 family glycosyltransferase
MGKLIAEVKERTGFPSISIVILNYNGIGFLEENLSTVFRSHYEDFEVIFVDNGSSDNSVRFVKSRFGQRGNLVVITSSANLGASVGRNLGIKRAKGDLVVFLDNDTRVDPEWLVELVRVFQKDPSVGVAQSKLLRAENSRKIDSAGGFLDYLANPMQRGLMQDDDGQFEHVDEIFYAGGAFMFRRDVLNRIGLFDADYFFWYEDTDLSWRSWLAGYRIVYVPKSIVYHHSSGTTFQFSSSESMQYWIVNQITTQLKNYDLHNLVKFTLPYVMMRTVVNIVLIKRSAHSRLFVKSVLISIRNWRRTLRKRIVIQSYVRRVKDEFVMRNMIRQGWERALTERKLGKVEIGNPCARAKCMGNAK